MRHRFRPRLNFWLGLANLLPDFTLHRIRAVLYRRAGFRLGRRVVLYGRLRIVGDGDIASRLTVGEGSLIATDVTLGLDGEITIGENVSIGPLAVLHTGTHSLGPSQRRMQYELKSKPIVIEDGAWIAMGAMILPGVTVGQGAVVAAGAVVPRDVPPNTLVAGNPATVQRELPVDDPSVRPAANA
ncbi:MAG: acyltransferase [Capsulimonadales bacterium]|nr:acyltransferase [Capsulimonadales bacterium]